MKTLIARGERRSEMLQHRKISGLEGWSVASCRNGVLQCCAGFGEPVPVATQLKFHRIAAPPMPTQGEVALQNLAFYAFGLVMK